MNERQILMIPGPTPLPAQALRAMAKPMINHRGPEFGAMLSEVEERLKQVFGTSQPIFLLTCSGTGAMEALVVNTLSPGDLVLSCPCGVFGERFAKIAETYGARVERLETPFGEAVSPARVRQRLDQDQAREIRALLLTHNETSTGVQNDLKALRDAAADHPALLLVDAVSSLAAMELAMDKWGLDGVASASQKALMAAPGLAFVAMSEKAWSAHRQARMPRFYFDLSTAAKFRDKGQTPFTPAVSQLFGLRESLELLFSEGLEACVARHRVLALATRRGIEGMGLSLFAKDGAASQTVTAVKIPAGLEIKKFREMLRTEYGVVISGGQASLENAIFRIGHLGHVGSQEVLITLAAVEMALHRQGLDIALGKGVSRAQNVFLGKSVETPTPSLA
ncbi:MAG: alanine--glyoxylate aminotransferase family protein, partial [Armatimonadetes bacterium]|nr:alanine--glyoxylate aminotransferase family protein [Armatimonadota bacterium]